MIIGKSPPTTSRENEETTLKISQCQFDSGIQTLASAFHKVVLEHDNLPNTNVTQSYCLDKWYLNRNNTDTYVIGRGLVNDYYLSHPPIIVSNVTVHHDSTSTIACDIDSNSNSEPFQNNVESNTLDDFIIDSSNDVDTLLNDPSIYTHDSSAFNHFDITSCQNDIQRIQQYTVQQNQQQQSLLLDIEFQFSIAYNHTWSVPILYFTAQHLNGISLYRNEVLQVISFILTRANHRNVQILNHYTNDQESNGFDNNLDENDDLIDEFFISQDEHPVTGIPSYFIHPCQTSSRLYTIFLSSPSSSTNNCESKNIDPAMVVLSFLSMTLPYLGFCIPSKMFQLLKEEIKNITTTTNNDSKIGSLK